MEELRKQARSVQEKQDAWVSAQADLESKVSSQLVDIKGLTDELGSVRDEKAQVERDLDELRGAHRDLSQTHDSLKLEHAQIPALQQTI